MSTNLSAQLTGTKTIPGSYSTITAAVTALNSAGVGAGGVTFNIAANYAETISATISLTATGTAANPIVFQKDPATSGSNPLITSYTGGTGTPSTAVQDGIWRMLGSDYVNIISIDLKDNAANTTNPSTMEYGYALYKQSATNGCQNVTIKNCTITLNNINNATSAGPMTEGSAGIIIMNALATTATTTVTPTSAAGTNSGNKFYSNNIKNCNIGISLIGYAAPSPFTLADASNDIGGSSSATGDTILNYGGASGATNPAAAIRTLAQYGLNVSYNVINNNNGSGTNHPNTLRGIYINTATSASSTVTYNTITINGGGTTQNITGIENVSGLTAASNTVNISNNTITNGTYSTATTGGFLGIYNNAATPATLTISSNTISNNASSATTSGFFYGIYNTGAASSTTINSNTFSGNSTANRTSGLFSGIYNSAATPSLTINSNTLFGNVTTASSGAYYAIYNSGVVTTTLNINSNNIGNSSSSAITFNAANSATNNLINNTGGSATAALSISNNDIQGISYAVQGTGANTYIINSAATLSQAINSNTFTNLNVNTTGNITFISDNVAVSASGTQNVNSNSIVGTFNKAGAGGTVTLFTSSAASASGAVINNNSNNFSAVTLTGSTGITGFSNTDAGSGTKTIMNNTFNNWAVGTGAVTGMLLNITSTSNAINNNTISNISGGGTITGMNVSTGNNNVYSNNIYSLTSSAAGVTGISIPAGTNNNIYLNNIYTLTSSAAAAVNGISLSGGTNNKVYKNKVYDLQASILGGTVNGILVSGGTVVTANIYNNLIGNLRTPASSAADPIRGISVTSTTANSTINVFYNTVYLNATSSGSNFGTTGIYHTTSATATTAALNLENNIIANTSTPTGTGLTVAYRRSSTTLTNYGSSSNNNLFYGGAISAARLLFYDGTNSDQTLTTYKARVASRDALSVTEDITSKFLSTTGSSSSFLHIDSTKSTLAESGGTNITGYTDDYDGQIRYGNTGYSGAGTSTDIGADEFNGIKSSALSGSYNVGTGQTYTSLTKAGGFFAAVNSLGLSGNVILNITSDLSEDGTNALYKWTETGVGNYKINIKPDASTLRTISGDVVAGMIRFNNANRVTINGSNGTTSNYLTFRNLNTAGTTGTAFTFINGAANDTIKYSSVEAYANATNGVILFSTSTVAGGNSNNVISNCNINATVSSNTGNVCIYSTGTVGNENTSNSILNDTIYNYRDRALDITATGSSSWTISGNSFYNGGVSGSINYAAASTLHGIRILGGYGYSILNNYIGGSSMLASGTNATYSSSTGGLTYQGILLTTTAASPASNIMGNTIGSIAVSEVPTAAGSNIFVGIETNGSGINIGGSVTGNGNIIGSNTINSSITVSTTTSNVGFTSNIRGINCNSSGGLVVGNKIGSIDISNVGSAPAPSTFFGIYVNNASAPSQINNNIIGSTGSGAASNSIRVLSSSTSTTTSLTGISIGAAVASTIQVNSNIIQNVSHQSNTTSGSFRGISNGSAAAAIVSITSNTITGNTNNATAGSFYGIYSNVNNASLTITNDTISNNTSTASTTGLLYGINTLGTPTTLTINGNVFSGNATSTLTTGGFVGIYNTAAATTLNINSNSLYGNTTSTSGLYYAISQGGAVTSTININSNSIGNSTSNAITYNAANASTQTFITNTAGTATAALSISNNDFQGINYATAGTGANTYISNSAATLSQAINSNTFTNLNVKTSGNITFISDNVIVSGSGTQNVNNNSIVGTFTKNVGGTVTLFTSGTASASGSVINNNSNNFSNITVTGATTIAGWVNTDAGSSTKNIQSNTFTNWVGGTNSVTAMAVNITGTSNAISGNAINNITGASTVIGITTSAGNNYIYSNIINTLSSTGSAAVTAISITGGAAQNIYKNKIYDISGSNAGTTINGILVSGGTTVTAYNNLVGDLRATVSNGTDQIRGISITSGTASSTINIYYNTVNINATSSGANFGTTGIYHTTNGTSTTATLNLRNNIISNTSTANGTGKTVAYRRSSTTLTNYGSSSNNNLFYGGTPAASKLIFYDGTNSDQTLATFQTRVSSRDVNSVTENLSSIFLSTTGSSSVFLHIDATQTTLVESGAANISGYTDDYDGQTRAGNTGYTGTSTSPDIGADEIFGLENIPPVITYTLLADTTSSATRNLTNVTITDNSGINVMAGTKPRIYYKRSNDANAWLDNTSSTNGWKYAEANNTTSPFNFTIDYSILYGSGAVTAGNIQYFVVAQDNATVANIAINSGVFAAAPSSVALTSAAFPMTGTINSYNIAFAGTYNVGTGEVFTSLTKAGGVFAQVNSSGLGGNVVFNVTSDLSEDGTNALNKWTEYGVGNYTLTIQPDAATARNISGNVVNGIIRINGAQKVKFDGSNGGSGNYLTFANTNTAGATGTAFTFINGASSDTVQYCNVQAAGNATNGAILFSTSTVAGGNSNNIIDNCSINSKVSSVTGNVSIYSAGTTGKENSNNKISNSTLYNYSDRSIDIAATGSTAWTISGNSIYNGNISGSINYAAASTLHGIRILGGTGYSISNNYIGGSAINAGGSNALYSSSTGNVSYQGILLTTSGASPVSNITGNTIAGISISSIPTAANSIVFSGIETSGSGISVGGSSAGNANLIGSVSSNSSIVVTTTTTSNANTSLIRGISISSTGGSILNNQVAGIDINNIGSSPAPSSFTGVYVNVASGPSQVNNNAIGSSSVSNSIKVLSSSTATATSLTGIGLGSSVNANMTLTGNAVSSISNLSTTSSGSFTGLSNGATGGTFTISNDTVQIINAAANTNAASGDYIGIYSGISSTISNNVIDSFIVSSTGANARIIGISVAGSSAHIISGNTIYSLATASTKAAASVETGAVTGSAIVGILNAATASGQSVSGNLLYNLNAINTSGINTVVTGIGVSATISGNIFQNRLATFTNKATGSAPGICGIVSAGGSFNLYNNSVKLDNSTNTNGVKIYGIVHAAGSNWNYYYNTVKIGGNATGTALRSAAFIRPVSGSLYLRNNVLVNTRTGTGTNYAISNLVSPPSSTWSSSSSDYNDLYSSDTTKTGEWGTATNKTFTQFQSASGGEGHSVSRSVSFIASLYDLQPDSTSNCALDGSATPITTPVNINTDIRSISRSATTPDMGAYEFSYASFMPTAGNSSPVCSGSIVSFTANPGIATSPTYSWLDPNGIVVSTAQNPSLVDSAGVYTVTVTDNNGCHDTATTTVTLSSRPTAHMTGPTSVCSGSNAVLTITASGSGSVSGTLNTGDTFSGTAPNITVNVSPLTTTVYKIATLNEGTCSSQPTDLPDTVTVKTTSNGTWTGAVSTDWNDAGNWCGGVPTSTSNVKITSGLTNYPVISSSASVKNINISTGATVINNSTLQINGTITNAGAIIDTSGTIEMAGASAQTIPGNTFQNNAVNSLIISNSSVSGVILGGKLDIYNSLTFSGSGMNLSTSDSLTLKSTATGTAYVGDITGNTVTGQVTVERYIPARKAWRILSIPTNTSQTVKQSWQEGATSTSSNPVPGYGTQLISNLSTWSANGFDIYSSGGASMKTYDVPTNTFTGLTSTANGIANSSGYFIFIRGDRTANTYTSPTTSTVLRTKGNLYVNDQPAITVPANKFVSIGNPYASAVNMSFITKTAGVKDFFYIWDPKLAGTSGYGAYQTFSNDGNDDYVVTPGDGSYGPSGTIYNYIESGLGFLVQGDSLSGGILTFKENAKGVSNGQIGKVASGSKKPSLHVNIYGVNADSSAYMDDGFLVNYDDSYSNAVDNLDAIKSTNTSENLSIKNGSKLLVIERRHTIVQSDTLLFNLTNVKAQHYRFELIADRLSRPGLAGFLQDNYFHTSTPLNMNGSTMVDFNIVNIPGSYAANRFQVVFNQSFGTLPVTFTSVKAYKKDKNISVEWKVDNENNIKQYEVEKSADGANFTKIAVTTPTGNGGNSAAYAVVDGNPFKGYNYYRIKSVSINGAISYTNIVKVSLDDNTPQITVYPNPVINRTINLQLNNLPDGSYDIRLLNKVGQGLLSKQIHHLQGNSIEPIQLDKYTPHGIYQLEVSSPDQPSKTIEVIY